MTTAKEAILYRIKRDKYAKQKMSHFLADLDAI